MFPVGKTAHGSQDKHPFEYIETGNLQCVIKKEDVIHR